MLTKSWQLTFRDTKIDLKLFNVVLGALFGENKCNCIRYRGSQKLCQDGLVHLRKINLVKRYVQHIKEKYLVLTNLETFLISGISFNPSRSNNVGNIIAKPLFDVFSPTMYFLRFRHIHTNVFTHIQWPCLVIPTAASGSNSK